MTILLVLMVTLGILLAIPKTRDFIKALLLLTGVFGYIAFALIITLLPIAWFVFVVWVVVHFTRKFW